MISTCTGDDEMHCDLIVLVNDNLILLTIRNYDFHVIVYESAVRLWILLRGLCLYNLAQKLGQRMAYGDD